MNETTRDVHKQSATTVACYGCGTELAPAQRTQVTLVGDWKGMAT